MCVMHSNSDNIEFIIYDNADEVIEAGPGNGFQSGGAKEHWRLLSGTIFGWQEKFLNSRRSRKAKAVTFWLQWQPFNSFYV